MLDDWQIWKNLIIWVVWNQLFENSILKLKISDFILIIFAKSFYLWNQD